MFSANHLVHNYHHTYIPNRRRTRCTNTMPKHSRTLLRLFHVPFAVLRRLSLYHIKFNHILFTRPFRCLRSCSHFVRKCFSLLQLLCISVRRSRVYSPTFFFISTFYFSHEALLSQLYIPPFTLWLLVCFGKGRAYSCDLMRAELFMCLPKNVFSSVFNEAIYYI